MKGLLSSVALMVVLSSLCTAQVGGGSVYGQGQGSGRGSAEATERAKRTVLPDDKPPTSTSMFLDASVLMNVKADEYVATFAVSQEGASLDEADKAMDATLHRFTADLKQLGIAAHDLYVDFVAQDRLYGYDVANDVAKEKVAGFEVKKNVSVHYRDQLVLDKLIEAASRSQIYDLVKVDYIVKDIDSVHSRLMAEAARIVKLKAGNRARLLDVRLRPSPQVYAERYSAYYPTDMYDSYFAVEAEDVSGNYYRQKFVVQNARKNHTFYFNALNGKLFDAVVNPIVIEPVVQFTLYLKVRYETGPGQPSTSIRSKG